MKAVLVTIFCLFTFIGGAFAQQDAGVKMAEALRSSGKIYVVVAVIAVIFLGLIIYLFTLDRRIKKIEQTNA
ncbi:MAG TPA: CcmD family protein [Sphingobacteriaceae bacterium]